MQLVIWVCILGLLYPIACYPSENSYLPPTTISDNLAHDRQQN